MSLTPAAISKLKVAELKEHLASRNLSTDGKKDELVARLQKAVEEDEAGKSAPEGAEEEGAAGSEEGAVAPEGLPETAGGDRKEGAGDDSKPDAEASESSAPRKFAPIQWVAPEPSAKPTNGAAPVEKEADAGKAGEKPFSQMTESEKIIARAKKYGMPVDEKLLAQAKLEERAKRFNIEKSAAAAAADASSASGAPQGGKPQGGKPAAAVDPEVLKKRQERFGTVTAEASKTVADADELERRKRRAEKFGVQEPVQDTFYKKKRRH
ncbi:hypothetical protein DFJ74DRAFT_689020 [Hyaloraphidium curvatum]|nr:hypothetical protein DFJ74DRAFT_689020 [Hyaloraphidium curvatum]